MKRVYVMSVIDAYGVLCVWRTNARCVSMVTPDEWDPGWSEHFRKCGER